MADIGGCRHLVHESAQGKRTGNKFFRQVLIMVTFSKGPATLIFTNRLTVLIHSLLTYSSIGMPYLAEVIDGKKLMGIG